MFSNILKVRKIQEIISASYDFFVCMYSLRGEGGRVGEKSDLCTLVKIIKFMDISIMSNLCTLMKIIKYLDIRIICS